MLLLLVGVAVGIMIVFLLRTLREYEAASVAGVSDRMEELEATVTDMARRLVVLEAIAVADEPVAPSDAHTADLLEDAVGGRKAQEDVRAGSTSRARS